MAADPANARIAVIGAGVMAMASRKSLRLRPRVTITDAVAASLDTATLMTQVQS